MKSLELLGISGKGRLQFCEDLEFLGIPGNSQLYKLPIYMDFLMKQHSIMLNANCQLIQCTHIADLLPNLKGLLDSMIIKVFIVMQNVSCSQTCQNHQTSISCSLVHNFHMCNNNYIVIYT